jgi:glycosyltransferase involved in cell wall biosynthesis
VHLLTPIFIQTSTPLVVTLFDLTPLFLTKAYRIHSRLIYRWTIHWLIRKKAHFIPISHCTGEDLHRFFRLSMDYIHPVHLGVDTIFHPEQSTVQIADVQLRYKLPPRFFLFIGAMNKRKNLDTLLRAYKLYQKKSHSNIQLVIAGRMDWGGRELQKAILREDLADKVVLTGYINKIDLPVVINQAVALVYPSLYEGFGLPPLEAIACGTPVIASNTGAIPETTGGNALLLDPYDITGFSDAMLKITEDDHHRDDLINRGIEWARQFTWQRTALETLKVYDHVLQFT